MPSLAGTQQVFENRVFPLTALFETTASDLDLAQASLAPWFFWQLHVLCVLVLKASDERTEPEAESKAEAVVSKGAYLYVAFM